MKVSTPMTKNVIWIATLLVAVLLNALPNARAAHVQLSGGDSNDGWVAPSSYVLAYDMNQAYPTPVDQTIQSVTFKSWSVLLDGNTAPGTPLGVSVTMNALGIDIASGVTLPYEAGSPYDVAMAAMIKTDAFQFEPESLTITITGLANGTYRVDEFVMSSNVVRVNQAFAVNGTTTDTFTLNPGYVPGVGPNNSWLIQNTIVVSDGTITMDVFNNNPVLAGFVVSLVPEPSATLLITIGGAFALVQRRRRSTR